MEPRGHDIALGGHDFRWWEWGDPAATPLVFLHGVTANAPTYGSLLERLASGGRHVIALDQRGHGESAHPGDYDRDRWVDDLDALRSSLDLDTVDVVGHSMGGGHATAFAATRPDAVRRLVTLDQPFWSQRPEDQFEYWTRCASLAPEGGFASIDEYLATVSSAFPRADIGAVATGGLGPTADGRVDWLRPCDPRLLGAYQRTEAEWRAVMAAITCPVLIVRAAESEVFTGTADEVAAAFPDGTPAEVSGSGHMLMWENVPGWTDTILGFLAWE